MDNQSLQPQSLPLLSLTPSQLNILNAHVADAMGRIIAQEFGPTPESQMMAMHQIIFQQGRRLAYQALMTYDEERMKELDNAKGEE